MTITLPRLEAILQNLPRLTLGLLGDLFLDRYLELIPSARELSLETGKEAYQVARVRNCPGALGTVMNNLAALGVGLLRPVTVVGDDGHGYDLRQALGSLPINVEAILSDPERLTPTYTKPLRPLAAGQWEELNRLDVRTRAPLSPAATRRVCEALRAVFADSDGLLVLDQVNEANCGVVNEDVRRVLGELALAHPGKLVFIDSRTQLRQFAFGVLKGNCSEILAAAGATGHTPGEVRAAAHALADRTGRPVFCTLGESGMLVAAPGEPSRQVNGYPVPGPIDIVGAGDSASSGIVVSLLSGADELEAAAVANLVASITVQQLGTTGTASPSQVLARWQEVSAR